MARSLTAVVLLLLALLASLELAVRSAPLRADDAPVATPVNASVDRQAEAAGLVRQLGNERYSKREQATEELIGLGIAAIPALREGQRATDREIRYRSERILRIVQSLDFQRRLQAFASDHNDQQGHDLPAWKSFREAIGDHPAARALFVSMQKHEPALLLAVEQGSKDTTVALGNRCLQLQQEMQLFRRELELGGVAALLFAASQPEVNLTPQSSSTVYRFCRQNSFQLAVAKGPNKELLRRILGAWIVGAEPNTAYQGLILAMQYEIPDGLVLAQRTLQNANTPAYVRQYAVLTMAKLGDKSHLSKLEPLLQDQTRVTIQRLNNVQYETQLRDVVLASILHLLGEDLKSFGFSRVQANAQMVFNPSSLGFQNDGARAEAFKKWESSRQSSAG